MTKPQKLFILQGNGPPSNRGCEAILWATLDLLREAFGPCRFINSPFRPDRPTAYGDLGPDVIHARPPRRGLARGALLACASLLRLRRRPEKFAPYLPLATATLALGGDNYTLDYGPPLRFFLTNEVTLQHGKPLVLWGASVGPFSSDPTFERFAARELRRVTLICARESETIRYLASIGVTDNVRAVADPAFLLKPEPLTSSPRELEVLAKPCIGVNLSPLAGRYAPNRHRWLARATECVRCILERTGQPVLLIPHVIQPFSNDLTFMRRIAARLPKYKERLAVAKSDYNCRQLKWIISHLTAFVGARTHATIAALSSGVPTLSIGYSMKARGINQDLFGHTDWVEPVEHMTGDSLAARLESLLAVGDQVRQHLADTMPDYQKKARQAAHYLREAARC